MKENDIVKIRNSAGILNIKLVEKLKNRNVFRGFDDRLKFDSIVRWEFHKNDWNYMITLCEKNPESTKMIIAFLTSGELEIWEAEMLGTEQDEKIFTLMQED